MGHEAKRPGQTFTCELSAIEFSPTHLFAQQETEQLDRRRGKWGGRRGYETGAGRNACMERFEEWRKSDQKEVLAPKSAPQGVSIAQALRERESVDAARFLDSIIDKAGDKEVRRSPLGFPVCYLTQGGKDTRNKTESDHQRACQGIEVITQQDSPSTGTFKSTTSPLTQSGRDPPKDDTVT